MADGSISSLPGKPSGNQGISWSRWFLPSIADLLFIVLLCSLSVSAFSTRLLNDAGIGWHIRTGQWILSTSHVPRVDPYSSIMAGKPWIAWEWLYDVFVGALESRLGLNGVVWLTAVVIAAAFAWTYKLMTARGTNLLAAVVLTLLALSASMIHVLARPHVATWLFVVMWYGILDSSERDCFAGKLGSNRWLWFLPISMIVWVNVHGGFLLGLVLCVCFWCSAFWTWRSTHGTGFDDSLRKIAFGKRLNVLSWISVLSAAATFVNPYGWKLHAHIFSYLTNTFFMDHIDEFQSPNFHLFAQKCFLLLVILMLATAATRRRSLKLSEGLLALFAMYAGLYASRNIPVASILLVLVIGPLLPTPGRISIFGEKMSAVDSTLRGHLWPAVAVVFVLLVDFNGGGFAGTLLADAHFDPNRMPVSAVNYLEKAGISQPILTPDYWGGYVIYRLYPKTKVVIDDRHDLYGERVLASYLKMVRPQPGWDDFLRDYNVSCVIMPKDTAITAMLNETPGWKSVYSDKQAVTFVKVDSTQKAANP